MTSIKSFVETVLASYGDNITDINVVFVPRQSSTKTKYNQFKIKVSGFTFKQNGKIKAVSYDKMMELFDGQQLYIYISESKTRKIIPSASVELLKIKTSMEQYVNKDTKETVLYYPSSTQIANDSSVAKKIIESMNSYENKNNDADDEEGCEFI